MLTVLDVSNRKHDQYVKKGGKKSTISALLEDGDWRTFKHDIFPFWKPLFYSFYYIACLSLLLVFAKNFFIVRACRRINIYSHSGRFSVILRLGGHNACSKFWDRPCHPTRWRSDVNFNQFTLSSTAETKEEQSCYWGEYHVSNNKQNHNELSSKLSIQIKRLWKHWKLNLIFYCRCLPERRNNSCVLP